jgi:two-component system, chemotaxis family, chemotaxis protein CheY
MLHCEDCTAWRQVCTCKSAPASLALNRAFTVTCERCKGQRAVLEMAVVVTIRIDFNRLRFLVIEDNAHMRRILRTLLHGFGSREVYEAEDGAAGLESFVHHTPDIVITDWAMPIFDGLELAQMIRQPGANPNPYVPIIMLTGHSEKMRVIAARDAGITEFLAKPISAKALYQRILNIVINPRPFIKSKTYFGPDRRRNVMSNYTGPERRRDRAELIGQQALLEKAKA